VPELKPNHVLAQGRHNFVTVGSASGLESQRYFREVDGRGGFVAVMNRLQDIPTFFRN
jgi:hypothetical protein